MMRSLFLHPIGRYNLGTSRESHDTYIFIDTHMYCYLHRYLSTMCVLVAIPGAGGLLVHWRVWRPVDEGGM